VPDAKLGGPVFEGVNSDVKAWANADGDPSWLHRFLGYLRSHGAMDQLSFMSFEHYPFFGCDAGAELQADLLMEPTLVRGIVATWREDGVPASVPLFITESNFAANGGGVTQRIEGALWFADWVGSALSSGVSGLSFYQYETEPLGENRECGRWGAYSMFITNDNFKILAVTAQYRAAQTVTQQWLEPVDRPHDLYPVVLGDLKLDWTPAITAYAAHRPDGEWSLLFVNKDSVARQVVVSFDAGPSGRSHFSGRVTMATFGNAQYLWVGTVGPDEIPNPDDPPAVTTTVGGLGRQYTLPPMSITVIRGPTTLDR